MSEDQDTNSEMNRRGVLRNAAALGALPAASQIVGAAPDETSVDVSAVVSHPDVRAVLQEAPKVQLREQQATVFSNESVVRIPANFGKLVAIIPSSSPSASEDVQAAFYFDRWMPGVRDSWSKGSPARLTTTDTGVAFQQAVTEDAEKDRLLSAIDRSEYDTAETKIVRDEDRGVVEFGYRDTTTREIRQLTAEKRAGASTQDTSDSELVVVEETTYGTESSGVSKQAECSDQIAADLLYCIWDYADCVFCWTASVAPPVALACWIIVCLDGGLSLALEYLTDFGCASGAARVYDCLQEWVDQYGDRFL